MSPTLAARYLELHLSSSLHPSLFAISENRVSGLLIVPTVCAMISVAIAETKGAVTTHRSRSPIGSNVKTVLHLSGFGILYRRSATMKRAIGHNTPSNIPDEY